MKSVLLAAFILVVSGCNTLKDAVDAKGSGDQRTYNKPFGIVWEKTLEIIKDSRLDLISEDRDEGKILAQKGMSVFTYGQQVAIFIEGRESRLPTKVEVISKRSLKTNLTARNWAPYIHKRLSKALE